MLRRQPRQCTEDSNDGAQNIARSDIQRESGGERPCPEAALPSARWRPVQTAGEERRRLLGQRRWRRPKRQRRSPGGAFWTATMDAAAAGQGKTKSSVRTCFCTKMQSPPPGLCLCLQNPGALYTTALEQLMSGRQKQMLDTARSPWDRGSEFATSRPAPTPALAGDHCNMREGRRRCRTFCLCPGALYMSLSNENTGAYGKLLETTRFSCE